MLSFALRTSVSITFDTNNTPEEPPTYSLHEWTHVSQAACKHGLDKIPDITAEASSSCACV